MNYGDLPANTRKMVMRNFEIIFDGEAALLKRSPVTIEHAVTWCRAERNRRKQRAYLARKQQSK